MDFSSPDYCNFLYDVASSIADADNKVTADHRFATNDGETVLITKTRSECMSVGLLFNLRITHDKEQNKSSWSCQYIDGDGFLEPKRKFDGNLSKECVDSIYDLYLQYAGVSLDHVELVDSNLRMEGITTAKVSLRQTKEEIIAHRLRPRLSVTSRK